jgi:NADP-reducing hydrogenase subunit HndC
VVVKNCLSKEANQIKDAFIKHLEEQKVDIDVAIRLTSCFGLCEKGLIVAIFPDEIYYQHVTPDIVEEIVISHLIHNEPIEDLMIKDPVNRKRIREFSQLNVFKKQKRIALRNCGQINPLEIDEYIASDGYFALANILKSYTPINVIEEMKTSGLRGRGGGGFLTGRKWEFAYQSKNDQKYVICNADEGDPGAFMDRAILEGDPHSVLEAMAINGYAIGANQGYIYVRAEYPVAVERLNHAIKQATQYGLLGNNILSSNFSFNIELRLGSGAFVCGEETALIASIEGNRGMPRLKPPFPAVSGLWGKPTNVNNVETFANVPIIFLKGAKWFKSIGTEQSSGTKVFALGGKIANTGLIEVPMGTTLT